MRLYNVILRTTDSGRWVYAGPAGETIHESVALMLPADEARELAQRKGGRIELADNSPRDIDLDAEDNG